MHQIPFPLELRPRPRSIQRSLRPLAVFKGLLLRGGSGERNGAKGGWEGKGKRREGKRRGRQGGRGGMFYFDSQFRSGCRPTKVISYPLCLKAPQGDKLPCNEPGSMWNILGPGRQVPKSYSTVVVILVDVVISSLKIPKAFLIRSAAQRNFAYTFVLTFPTVLRFSANVTLSFT